MRLSRGKVAASRRQPEDRKRRCRRLADQDEHHSRGSQHQRGSERQPGPAAIQHGVRHSACPCVLAAAAHFSGHLMACILTVKFRALVRKRGTSTEFEERALHLRSHPRPACGVQRPAVDGLVHFPVGPGATEFDRVAEEHTPHRTPAKPVIAEWVVNDDSFIVGYDASVALCRRRRRRSPPVAQPGIPPTSSCGPG